MTSYWRKKAAAVLKTGNRIDIFNISIDFKMNCKYKID